MRTFNVYVHTYKYLEDHFTSNISWEAYINRVTAKANRSLGFIRRTLHLANWETKLLAYTALVRAQLEYPSVIGNPHQTYVIEKIESLQNRATRFILENYTRTNITKLKEELDISLLVERRYPELTHYTCLVLPFPIKERFVLSDCIPLISTHR